MIGDLAQPEIEGVAKAEAPSGEPALTYTLTTKEGEEVRFRYYRADDQTAYLVRSDQPWRYTVAQSHVTRLAETAPKKLLAGKGSGDDAQTQAKAGAS